jgi:tetratricopeptide (TPR) repeat protein
MDCEQVRREQLAERYLLGQLTEPEQDAYEQHYFECAKCFAELRLYEGLHVELKRSVLADLAEPAAKPFSWRWAWAFGATAILLTAGLAWWQRDRSREAEATRPTVVARNTEIQPPSQTTSGDVRATVTPSLSELGRVDPPEYAPVLVRGATDIGRIRFRQAMEFYGKGDYQAAIAGLRSASELDPQEAEYRFYYGICLLVTGRESDAISVLRATVALGDTPYLEHARYYLAKALIQKREFGAAQNELKEVIRLQGDLQNDAQQLLRQVRMIDQALP